MQRKGFGDTKLYAIWGNRYELCQIADSGTVK